MVITEKIKESINKSVISVTKIKPIITLKYILFPETTEKDQIKNAKNTYGLL